MTPQGAGTDGESPGTGPAVPGATPDWSSLLAGLVSGLGLPLSTWLPLPLALLRANLRFQRAFLQASLDAIRTLEHDGTLEQCRQQVLLATMRAWQQVVTDADAWSPGLRWQPEALERSIRLIDRFLEATGGAPPAPGGPDARR